MYCLIVEDHAQARDWLLNATVQAFDSPRVVSVATLLDANRHVAEELPDVALVDLGLPDGSGLSLIEKLNKRREDENQKLTIVVSTVMNDDQSLFSAIRAGADGYILKEETVKNLVEMLRGIHDNKPPLSPSIAYRLLTHFRESRDKNPLAPRENEVLQLISKGYSVPKVAELLNISSNTASGYVKNIYQKLNVSSRAEAALEASRRGLV